MNNQNKDNKFQKNKSKNFKKKENDRRNSKSKQGKNRFQSKKGKAPFKQGSKSKNFSNRQGQNKKYKKNKNEKVGQYAEITIGGNKYKKNRQNSENFDTKREISSGGFNTDISDKNINIKFPEYSRKNRDPFGDDLFTDLKSDYVPSKHSALTFWTLVRWGVPSKVSLMPSDGNTIYRKGSKVLIDTEKGQFLGQVVKDSVRKNEKPQDNPRKILSKATPEDLKTEEKHIKLAEEAMDFAKKRIEALNMEMKLFHTIVTHSGKTILFYFTANGRVDFRKLVRNLAAKFSRRIEMRQMGVRDDAKIIGGLGHCGRPLCCSSYLDKFLPVSIRMAKDQNLVLNPQNVSGQCGRLKCCLAYEQDFYTEIKKRAPKPGKKVNTPKGRGTILEVNYFTEKAKVALSEQESEYFYFNDLNTENEKEKSETN